VLDGFDGPESLGVILSQMKLEQAAEDWQRSGLVIIPEFLQDPEIAELRRICDGVLQQAIAEAPDRANASNIAYLTERRYFRSQEADLLRLLEFIADRRVVSLLTHVSGQDPLFHNTQYFYNPDTISWDGDWHRDTQFLAPETALEQVRLKQHTGVHFRVALVADSQLEYVPGSEQRWDSVEELAIRKGSEPSRSDMPGRRKIKLRAGDACLFHAWGIHRGTYHAVVPRRTLDIIYGWGGACSYCPPPPMCFTDPNLLARLSPAARKFFDKFINAYAKYWDQS
jgi:ectoine hydroxylase-related dioxygenase (phytanoyl-CoA dioxygenase family)